MTFFSSINDKYHNIRNILSSNNINYIGLLNVCLNKILHTEKLSVAWLLVGNENVGSSRIHGINICNYLKKASVNCDIIQKPCGYNEQLLLDNWSVSRLLDASLDVIVFQKVHKGSTLRLAEQLSARGTKTIFLMADLFDTDMPFVCDHTIVVSDILKKQLVHRGVGEELVTVIPDPIETEYSLVKSYAEELREGVKVVWVGAEGNWSSLEIVQSALQDESLRDYELVTISNHPLATMKWDIETVWGHILDCDIAVIPANMTRAESLVKSNNRLTMFKALGMPVICSPLPSYQEIVAHGKNGYLASTREEWVRCFQVLGKPLLRRSMGLTGREIIFEEFGIEAIGNRYLELLCSLAGKRVEHSR